MKEGGEGGSGGGGGSKIGRMAEAPFRVLRRARDAYVNGMTGIAGRASSRGIVGASRGYRFPPPRPDSGRGNDLGELLRSASAPIKATEGAVARSQSLGIARIDENEACDFSGDVVGGPFWPRSRSSAEVENRVGGFLP
ncbi:unnamed protein product [Spirodela intermedia]|uniref:Uncharacterized protein n=1 Tax=Spirodela intermedia TaxID=51605 RepID=A0A7I8KQV9_SPIIN|nr:unnamed protein product [Spirodela intermedia]